ncbi:MAG TPA: sugar-transfer associated ATP-grasp domain-containing protein [Flavobacterium sp.]
MLTRFLYIAYYIKKLDKTQFFKFVNHVVTTCHIQKWKLYFDMVSSSIKYNISLNEYFLFHFYNMNHEQRMSYAGTGFMYEYQLKMNPKSKRKVLINKLEFLKVYKDFVRHEFASLTEIAENPKIAEHLLSNTSEKIVLKSSTGQCGRGIEVRNSTDFTADTLVTRLKELDNDFVEEYVSQHPVLNELSPSGLNTIRIITQVNKSGAVEILGARLRITVNSAIDNMAAGNIAAFVNPQTGVVEGPGVYSDITKPEEFVHPITGIQIVGFQIPLWKETIEMVTAAALVDTGNRSIGWDVAITSAGPELIEGNHDWCKLLWQLPARKGLKQDLIVYL